MDDLLQTAFDKSEDYYPQYCTQFGKNIYNVENGPAIPAYNSMKDSYLQVSKTKDSPVKIWQKKTSNLTCKGIHGFWCVRYIHDQTQTLLEWAGHVFGSLLHYQKFGNKPYQ